MDQTGSMHLWYVCLQLFDEAALSIWNWIPIPLIFAGGEDHSGGIHLPNAQNLNSSSDEMATRNLQTFLEVSIISCLDIPTILSHVADRLILS